MTVDNHACSLSATAITPILLMTTFINRRDESGVGRRLAVKDCIDVAGSVTTGGCPAVAATTPWAKTDAACVELARNAGLHVIGKTNLHELCHGGSGINEHYGTPVNPCDRLRVPGGSSSGSAVAVATGAADVALGTDTSGSVRIPAAACGVAGLKTTHGLVPMSGILPLAPSLDSVGLLTPDIGSLHEAATWLIPGLRHNVPAKQVLRVRSTVPVRKEIDDAVDNALLTAGYPVRDIAVPAWQRGGELADLITDAQAARTWGHLLTKPELLGTDVRALLEHSASVSDDELHSWRTEAHALGNRITRLIPSDTVLALPTLSDEPPLLTEATHYRFGELCGPVNVAGLCALSLPVPAGGFIASLQLIAPPYRESLLLATAARIEAALRRAAGGVE